MFDVVDGKGERQRSVCVDCLREMPSTPGRPNQMIQNRLFSADTPLTTNAAGIFDFGFRAEDTIARQLTKIEPQVNGTDPRQKIGQYIRYVVGFMFDVDIKNVVLIRKKKPAWQAGRLNGPGGKIEDGETPLEAMVREFREETGVAHDHWNEFNVLRGHNGRTGLRCDVHFFSAFVSTDVLRSCRTTTTEEIEICSVLREMLDPRAWPRLMFNLPWLIPMALSMDRQYLTQRFEVVERCE
jgi:8-oxo-dGTP diphosphatase